MEIDIDNIIKGLGITYGFFILLTFIFFESM